MRVYSACGSGIRGSVGGVSQFCHLVWSDVSAVDAVMPFARFRASTDVLVWHRIRTSNPSHLTAQREQRYAWRVERLLATLARSGHRAEVLLGSCHSNCHGNRTGTRSLSCVAADSGCSSSCLQEHRSARFDRARRRARRIGIDVGHT